MSQLQLRELVAQQLIAVQPLAALMESKKYGEIVAQSIADWDSALVLEDADKGEVVFRGAWKYVDKRSDSWRDQVTRFLVDGERSSNKPDMQQLLLHLFPAKQMVRDLTLKVSLGNFPRFLMPPLAKPERVFWFENKGQVDLWLRMRSQVHNTQFFLACGDNWATVNAEAATVNQFRRSIVSGLDKGEIECCICLEDQDGNTPIVCDQCCAIVCQACGPSRVRAGRFDCPICRQGSAVTEQRAIDSSRSNLST